MFSRVVCLLPTVLALFVAGAPPCPAAAAPAFNGPQLAGQLAAPPRNEASGLAASRRAPDLLWTHDDSGGDEALFAVSTTGEHRATLRITGVKNSDWEDVASVELDGTAWLVIGDVGDNDAKRKRTLLHFVAEPPPEKLTGRAILDAKPAATFRLTFSDGSRDCEAVAIDPKERAIYLLSKRDIIPRLYRATLPSGPLKSADLAAEFLAPVPHLARASAGEALLFGLIEKGRARPCGMDFATDGSAAVVVTYINVAVFPRAPGESWADAFSRAPLHLPPHELAQAEAICFSRDARTIYVASEETRKLLRYDRK